MRRFHLGLSNGCVYPVHAETCLQAIKDFLSGPYSNWFSEKDIIHCTEY